MRLVFLLIIAAVLPPVASVQGQQLPDRRPSKTWNRAGPLGDTPKHVTDAFPLSDQRNKGDWVKYEPMSDEFEGDEIDLSKGTVGMYWWKGRRPALFSSKNVTVSDGKLHLTMQKEKVPAKFEKLGYKDYTSAALHTKVRSSYGWRWFHADDQDVWNDVRIVCKGTRITTIMNGVTIADYDGAGRLDDEAHRSHHVGLKGHIGLQIHPGNELLIRFKDIEVRELE